MTVRKINRKPKAQLSRKGKLAIFCVLTVIRENLRYTADRKGNAVVGYRSQLRWLDLASGQRFYKGTGPRVVSSRARALFCFFWLGFYQATLRPMRPVTPWDFWPPMLRL